MHTYIHTYKISPFIYKWVYIYTHTHIYTYMHTYISGYNYYETNYPKLQKCDSATVQGDQHWECINRALIIALAVTF